LKKRQALPVLRPEEEKKAPFFEQGAKGKGKELRPPSHRWINKKFRKEKKKRKKRHYSPFSVRGENEKPKKGQEDAPGSLKRHHHRHEEE